MHPTSSRLFQCGREPGARDLRMQVTDIELELVHKCVELALAEALHLGVQQVTLQPTHHA